MVTDLNEFIIRNGAHVDDADYRLANDYLAAVKDFHAVVSTSAVEIQVPYGQTMRLPPDLVRRLKNLSEAQQRVSELRDELRRKVRLVIGGTA